MPEKADEITRLFREGHPDITLLDDLDKARTWPVLNSVFHTESPVDVIALALCHKAKVVAVDDTPGCLEEILHLLGSSIGMVTHSFLATWVAGKASIGH